MALQGTRTGSDVVFDAPRVSREWQGGLAMLVSMILGCTPSSDGPVPFSGTGTEDSGNTGQTGQTGHTGDTSSAIDCSSLLAPEDITFTSTSGFPSEEDVDFDGEGYLLTQLDTSLVGMDRTGATHLIAPEIGTNATGIRSTVDGLVAIAEPVQGVVSLVDPGTGCKSPLLTGLTNPNGLEAGEDGLVYVSENTVGGLLRSVDPATGSVEVLLEASNLNGVVLSPDEQTLYVTSASLQYDGSTRILSVERGGDGAWDPSSVQEVFESENYVGSITVDACGNLYGVEFREGRVFRLDPSTGAAEILVSLGGGYFAGLHYPPGFGAWNATSLYLTDRIVEVLFEIPTSVPGSHVLMP